MDDPGKWMKCASDLDYANLNGTAHFNSAVSNQATTHGVPCVWPLQRDCG